jgi:hypothetical protein
VELWVESAEDAGSTFWIELPAAEADELEVENGLAHLLDRLYLTSYQQFRVWAILPPEI